MKEVEKFNQEVNKIENLREGNQESVYTNYFSTLNDTEITHSNIIDFSNSQSGEILIKFRKQVRNKNSVAVCRVPSFKTVNIKGFTDEEVQNLEDYIVNNFETIWNTAQECKTNKDNKVVNI